MDTVGIKCSLWLSGSVTHLNGSEDGYIQICLFSGSPVVQMRCFRKRRTINRQLPDVRGNSLLDISGVIIGVSHGENYSDTITGLSTNAFPGSRSIPFTVA